MTRGSWLWSAMLSFLLVACGAKTGLAPHVCETDADCSDGLACTGLERCVQGVCADGAPVACESEDPCTRGTCVEPPPGSPATCAFEDARIDADGDGYDRLHDDLPLACGDDCNDDDAGIHPGATEACNAADDDCDVAVDEGALFSSRGAEQQLTDDLVPSRRGGVAFSEPGEVWGTTFWEYRGGTSDIYYRALERDGRPRAEPIRLSQDSGDAFGASIAWAGDAFAVAWEDRRDGDLEIYFNRVTIGGARVGADRRITETAGMSISPRIAWTGSETVIVWQDGRHRGSGDDNFEVYAAFMDAEGFEIGEEVRLTDNPANSEAPVVATRPGSIGIAFVDGRTGTQAIWFVETDPTGRPHGPEQQISLGPRAASSPAIVSTADGWLIAWDELTTSGIREVWASHPGSAPFRVAGGTSWARSPQLVDGGDGVMVVYADDARGRFDLYATYVGGEPVRISSGDGESVFPLLARSVDGIGVLFEDDRDGDWEVFFAQLWCAIP